MTVVMRTHNADGSVRAGFAPFTRMNAGDVQGTDGSGLGGSAAASENTTRHMRVAMNTIPVIASSPRPQFTQAIRCRCEPQDVDPYSSQRDPNTGALIWQVYRAELGTNNGPNSQAVNMIVQGQYRAICYWIRISDSTLWAPRAWNLMGQNKGEGIGNGVLNLVWNPSISGGARLQLEQSMSQTYNSKDMGVVYTYPIATPRLYWLRVCIEIFGSSGSDGWCRLSGDPGDGNYRELMPRRNRWTLKFDSSNRNPVRVGPSIGLYMARNAAGGTVGRQENHWTGYCTATAKEEAEAEAKFFVTDGGGGGPVDPPPTGSGPVDVTDAAIRAGFYTRAASQLLRTDDALNP